MATSGKSQLTITKSERTSSRHRRHWEFAHQPGFADRGAGFGAIVTEGADASVGLLLVDDRGWILLQLRDGRGAYPYHWGTVGGAVEPDETIEAALQREVHEETGYSISHPVVFGSSGILVLPEGQRRHATIFVGRYDRSQPIHCNEGLQITFVDPSTLNALEIYPGQRELILEALRHSGHGA